MAAKREIKVNVTLSAEVRARIAADASEQEVSVNDVIVRILADHFGVKFEGTGRRSPGVHKLDEGMVILRRVPERLDEKLYKAARKTTKKAVVEAALRAHYKLDEAAAV